eukprot:3366094-Pyramimonas_sp.AAC.1
MRDGMVFWDKRKAHVRGRVLLRDVPGFGLGAGDIGTDTTAARRKGVQRHAAAMCCSALEAYFL